MPMSAMAESGRGCFAVNFNQRIIAHSFSYQTSIPFSHGGNQLVFTCRYLHVLSTDLDVVNRPATAKCELIPFPRLRARKDSP